MIGAAQFKLMKPTAYLINTCRGPVVDEPALIEALRHGTIAGAGLDVFDQEPPPPNNPLFALQNVILTAHFAGPTWENQYTRFRNAFDNCQRVIRGDKPLWVIPELQTELGSRAGRVSGMTSQTIRKPSRPMPARTRKAASIPARSAISPDIVVLTAAPRYIASPRMPMHRLKCEVPRVRSAASSGRT